MKFKEVRFGNFKCFDNINLELGRITLLTGPNSSGKSSIIYGILGALQTGEFPLQFSPNGKYIEMGDFQEISFKHIKSNKIKIGFTIQKEKEKETITIDTFWDIDKIRKLPKLFSFKASSDYYSFEVSRERNYTITFNYFKEKDPQKKLRSGDFEKKLFTAISEIIKEKFIDNKFDFNIEKKSFVEFKFRDFTSLNTKINEEGGFLFTYIFYDLLRLFKNMDKQINYISSFRLHPDRTYYEQSKTELKIGKSGERYTDQIILWQTKKSKKYDELLKLLKNLSLANAIKAKRLEGGRYELLVQPHKDSVFSSLADVGFGISQFLPIIVADLQLSNDSTLFISQPEIHLHPSVQASFADYLVSQIKSTNKSYVIETHSEYLINRIRLAIVRKEIDKNLIRPVFFSNNGNIVENYNLDFLESGEIKNAPKDFFETYMMDVMNIAINSVD